MKRLRILALSLAAALAALAAPVMGQRPALALLDRLEPGRWELRMRDGNGSVTSICLHNGRQLIQLRHPAQTCSQLTVADNDTEVIVQYTCRGNGYGRTHVRSETTRLLQIDSQGIVSGSPFAFTAEARRVGTCSH